jgi:uncharacterized phage-associated protein
MTSLRFDIRKTTEAASVLVDLEGGKINYMKLLKLLYLADRKAYQNWARPITYDHYVSMDNGQVLSTTYRLIKQELGFSDTFWSEVFTQCNHYELSYIQGRPQIDKLSDNEIELLKEIYSEFGDMDQFELADYTHELPEYEDPKGSSIPTDLRKLLRVLEYSDEEVTQIEQELEEEERIKMLFSA